MKDISIKPPIIISIVMLLLALLPLPIGYYSLLRFVVCITTCFLAWQSYNIQKMPWMWTMGMIALIFNPLIPLYLGRELWFMVDIVVAIILGTFLFTHRKSK